MPPRTTKRRATTNLKTKNNHNCQKIELYGSPTTKELKKKHSFRPVEGAEMGSLSGEDTQQGCGLRLGRVRQWLMDLVFPHSCADKLGGTTGDQDRPRNPGFQHGEIKPQNLLLKKPVAVEAAKETPSLIREFTGETHRILQHTQTHPLRNQHQKVLVGSRGSD